MLIYASNQACLFRRPWYHSCIKWKSVLNLNVLKTIVECPWKMCLYQLLLLVNYWTLSLEKSRRSLASGLRTPQSLPLLSQNVPLQSLSLEQTTASHSLLSHDATLQCLPPQNKVHLQNPPCLDSPAFLNPFWPCSISHTPIVLAPYIPLIFHSHAWGSRVQNWVIFEQHRQFLRCHGLCTEPHLGRKPLLQSRRTDSPVW